jgi:UMF1 family MFS transporter
MVTGKLHNKNEPVKQSPLTAAERSWILYDVGNSAFVLVMVTALMPIYFKDVIAIGMTAADSTAKWGFANSAAALAVALAAPFLGALADGQRSKKQYLAGFAAVGIIFTLLLTMIMPGQWAGCLILFIVARIGWAGANIFYDAFLVDVTSPARMDRISALGYGFGYIGSIIPFLVIIALLFAAGVADGLPPLQTKIGFGIVAIWWLLLSLPAYFKLEQRSQMQPAAIISGVQRLAATFREIRRYRQVVIFLVAYFFYIDGVGTIISMSTAYGRDLGFSPTLLLVVLLFIQVVAFPFTLVYGRLAEQYGVKRMLYCGIGIYCLATLLGFFLASISGGQLRLVLFWGIAFLIASSMGGMQALSRSFFARLIPGEKSAEFFGFYNVFGKFAAITGPAIMALVTMATGHSRWGLLSILLLFIAGAVVLTRVEE